MTSPCSAELLQSALAGNLPPDRELWLQRHLEHCAECSTAIEQLAGGTPWCEEVAALLAGDAVPARDEWSEADFSVDHLDASEEPNTLGRLGDYDVLEIIGRGGMGVVLKGFDRELNRYIAIKVLAPHLAQSPLAKKRFAREAQAAAAVVHPNVMAIHQVQPNGRLPFLVMPLVAGESLAQRLTAQGRLELKETLRIGMQAAAALSAAHEQGLVHRDVKPANILLEKGIERAMLTDFGLARAADDVSMTRWGIIAGTPQYMSPEQAKGEPLDGRSDLFSLGCVLYEMATGVSPFKTDSTLATLRRLVDDPPPALASLDPELPPWFVAIVDRLLEKDPARRFGSAKEVSELLEGCLAHLQQPTSVALPNVLISLRRDERITAERDEYDPAVPRPNSNPKRQRGLFRAVLAYASGYDVRKPFTKGTLVMLTLLGISLFAVGVATTNPPNLSGQWRGEDWGQVALTQTAPGQYAGTYTETVGKGPGKIDLKWSRIERQFNGTWSEGEDRFGELSIRLADDEIRGALTTDPKSKINPATPRLAPFLWTRADVPAAVPSTPPATNAPHAHALHFDQLHYAMAPPSTKFTSGDFTISLWLKPASQGRRGPTVSQYIVNRHGYGDQRGDFALKIHRLTGELDFCLLGDDGGRSGWIFGLDVPETRMHSTIRFDQWNHVVITRCDDTYTMWMNGKRAVTEQSPANVSDADNTNPFTIGGATSEPGVHELFKGDIDDLRIFRRCLSDGEIIELHQSNGDVAFLNGEGRVRIGQLCEAYWKGELFEGEKEPVPIPTSPTGNAPHPRAVQFDGEHYATVRQPPKFTSGDFTISLWFNPKTNPVKTGNSDFLVMRGYGYRDQRGDIGFDLNGNTGNLDFKAAAGYNQWIFGWSPQSRLHGPVRYGQWNHVLVTRRGNTYTMWMNGTRVVSEESTADIADADNTNPFIVGGFMGVGPWWNSMYRGALDDFRIFRRCLSDKEIGTLYDCNGDETSLHGEGRVTIGPLQVGGLPPIEALPLLEGIIQKPSESVASSKLVPIKKFTTADTPLSGSLTVQHGAWSATLKSPETLHLFEVAEPDVEDCKMFYRAKLSTQDFQGKVYLEMWCRLPGKGESFSRGLDNTLSGTTGWISCETPFVLKVGERPDLIRLNVKAEGTGTVLVKDIELLRTDSASACIIERVTWGIGEPLTVVGKAPAGARIAFHAGTDRGNGWSCEFPRGGRFTATLESTTPIKPRQGAQGLNCRVVMNSGEKILTLQGASRVGSAILSEGWFDFVTTSPGETSDGASTATIGHFISKSGERVDIHVTLSPPEKKHPAGIRLESRDIPSTVETAVMVISTCAEGDPRVKEAISSLKGLDENQVVTELAKFLDSQTALVRRAAVYVLWKGAFNSIEPAVGGLLKLCNHDEDLTRGMAALAIGANRVGRSLAALEKMTTDDKSGYARRCAAYALGLLGDPAAIGTLEKALKDPEILVQRNAKAALDILRKAADHAPSKSSAETSGDQPVLPTETAEGLRLSCKPARPRFSSEESVWITCQITNTTSVTKPVPWSIALGNHFRLTPTSEPIWVGELVPRASPLLGGEKYVMKDGYPPFAEKILYLPAGKSVEFQLDCGQYAKPQKFEGHIVYDPSSKRNWDLLYDPINKRYLPPPQQFRADQLAVSNTFSFEVVAGDASSKEQPAPATRGDSAATGPTAKPKISTDQIVVEDLALQMIVAIREKDDKKLRSFASDRIKGWPAALPVFAVELRERYRQNMGNERFDLRASESLVEDDLAAVRCTGPKELGGKCLVLFFIKTDKGWLNYSLRASMDNVPLTEHLANLKKEIHKAAGKS